MKRSWLNDTTTVSRSHAGVTGSPSRLSRSPCVPKLHHWMTSRAAGSEGSGIPERARTSRWTYAGQASSTT